MEIENVETLDGVKLFIEGVLNDYLDLEMRDESPKRLALDEDLRKAVFKAMDIEKERIKAYLNDKADEAQNEMEKWKGTNTTFGDTSFPADAVCYGMCVFVDDLISI